MPYDDAPSVYYALGRTRFDRRCRRALPAKLAVTFRAAPCLRLADSKSLRAARKSENPAGREARGGMGRPAVPRSWRRRGVRGTWKVERPGRLYRCVL